ncbi:two component transcriptional regulator [Caballeronia fortuita]|uniref:Two component transcriptional regulator n=1 Tax=Caballeronia fortuita TaxID=1777138 RepID=A0A157ZBP9_9BURK|nr:two component transcriptional regulator [Caballeronia fortuita]
MHSVLLVDDDAESLSALQFIFEVHDFRVAVAANGNLAMAEVAKHLPDLVVTDMEMPGMDGIELCKRLRCHPSFASVPVVLVSGGEPPTHAPVVWDAFVGKPVDFYELIEAMERLPLIRLDLA